MKTKLFILSCFLSLSSCCMQQERVAVSDSQLIEKCEKILHEKIGEVKFSLLSQENQVCTFALEQDDKSQSRLIGQRVFTVNADTREVKELPRR